MTINPLAYGYMRVSIDAAESDTRATELGIRAHAQSLGCELVAIYQETVEGSHDTYVELVEEVDRIGAEHVIVPDLGHLSCNKELQRVMCSFFEAEVHTLPENSVNDVEPL
ncbi:recombinase family protein [Streptomyces sp. NPDC003688]